MSDATPSRATPWHLDSTIRRTSSGGMEWSYIDTGGNGRPLIMLPGSVGTCEMFFKQIASLPQAIRVISVGYPAEPNPDRLADGLGGFLDGLGIDRASILGSSFGGYWAQFFALKYSSRVETLFLGNIFRSPQELFSNPLFSPKLVRESSSEDFQKMWRDRVSQNPDTELKRIQLDMLGGRQTAENLHARFMGVIHAEVCPMPPIPQSQIVVVDCEDDPIIPAASRQDVRDQYPDAELHTLSSGGHYPHILNQKAYDEIIVKKMT